MIKLSDIFSIIGFLVVASISMIFIFFTILFIISYVGTSYEDYFGDIHGLLSQDHCGSYNGLSKKNIQCYNETMVFINKRHFWFTSVKIPERLCDLQTSDGEWWRVNGVTYDFTELNILYNVRHDDEGFRLWVLSKV